MRIHDDIRRLWRASQPLTAVGLGMFGVFALTTIGLVADSRLVEGAPVWLKPIKFAISTGIYALTLAWILTYFDDRPWLRTVVGWLTAAVLVIEVALIEVQAARGVSSHFNVSTSLDAGIYAVMGIAIMVAWAASIALAVAIFRHRFPDDVLGWAIRIGLLITIVGSATGGLMTRPAEGQLAGSQRPTMVGAHTVGGPDGGHGLPVTGWSLEHGDLRVPHFLGLHAIQVIPALAWLTRRTRSRSRRRRAVSIVATSYASFFGITLAAALAGQSLFAPNPPLVASLALWLAATALGLLFIEGDRRSASAFPADAMVPR